ncbi:efflux RND transporter periplasmic adaptor subunit [Phosphitispora sp. TUW77]|uniref:efflux RND transporter periplasmic adaptor subunit n=1 Tax=Phosphitispora sp. TUW77 TaxID=3152361 RepID=UPI003AB2CBFA
MVYCKKVARLMVLLLVAFAFILSVGCGSAENNTEDVDKAVPVKVSEAKKDNISIKTVISGRVISSSEVIIVPKIGGKVAQVPVDIGSKVKKGDLLLKIDTTDLEIQLSAAINGLTNAKLTHDQAVLNFNNAKTNYERMKSLYQEGAVSQQQLEQAELQYNLAKDAVNQPVAESAMNQVELIRQQITDATITSPIDGEVAARQIDPGEMAGSSSPVMSVVNIDRVFIEGTVAESDIALVKEGQEVTVRVDAAGNSFKGTVKLLSPVANAQTKGYPVKIEIDNPDHNLKPGMFAEIELVTKNKEGVITIPKEALITRNSLNVIYMVKGSIVEQRQVEPGIETDNVIEIVNGLSEGEMFVIEGQHSLADKIKVTVINAN